MFDFEASLHRFRWSLPDAKVEKMWSEVPAHYDGFRKARVSSRSGRRRG